MNTLESTSAFPERTRVNIPLPIYRPPRATGANRILTLENAEKGIVLRVGEQFTLNLGQGLWTVRVRDEMMLTSADGVTFQARAGGKTCLFATGVPPRADSGPPSSRRKLFLEIPVTVLP